MLSFLTSVAYCATEQLWKCSKFLKYHWFVVIPDFLSHRKTEQHCICCEGFWRKFRIFNFTYCFQVCSECCEFLVYHSYPLYLFFKKDTNCYLIFCLVFDIWTVGYTWGPVGTNWFGICSCSSTLGINKFDSGNLHQSCIMLKPNTPL
jgi:hypothetical protein